MTTTRARYGYTGYRILDFAPAPTGWTAHYITPTTDGGFTHWTLPVAGWLTVEEWCEDIDGNRDPRSTPEVAVVAAVHGDFGDLTRANGEVFGNQYVDITGPGEDIDPAHLARVRDELEATR